MNLLVGIFISLSFPSRPHRSGVGAPVVGDVDGEYNYESKKHVLQWRLPVIDASNKTGSMEFSIPAIPDDFFPINVSFVSTKLYCHVEVSHMAHWGRSHDVMAMSCDILKEESSESNREGNFGIEMR